MRKSKVNQKSIPVQETDSRSGYNELVEKLITDDTNRIHIYYQIQQSGVEVVPPLIKAINNRNPDVRLFVYKALADLMDKRALWPLIKRIERETYSELTDVLYRSIRKLLYWHGLDEIHKALKGKSNKIRESAINILQKFGDRHSLEPLLGKVNKGEPMTRLLTIEAIAAISEQEYDKKALSKLQELTNDNIPEIRAAALLALERIETASTVRTPAPPVFPDHEKLDSVEGVLSKDVLQALNNLQNKDAIDFLLGKIRNPYFEEGWEVLKTMITGVDFRTFLNFFSDPEKWIRRETAISVNPEHSDDPVRDGLDEISASEKKSLVNSLIRLLDDTDRLIRSNAIKALQRFNDPRSLKSLCKCLSDKEYPVRVQAACALGDLQDKRATKHLFSALESNEPGFSDAILIALWQISDKRAVLPLLNLLKNDNIINRDRIIYALGGLKDKRAIKNLIEEVKNGNPEIKSTAVAALGEIGDPVVFDLLVETLKDDHPKVRQESAYALQLLKDKRAIKPLITAYNDFHPEVRNCVQYALRELGYTKKLNYQEK